MKPWAVLLGPVGAVSTVKSNGSSRTVPSKLRTTAMRAVLSHDQARIEIIRV